MALPLILFQSGHLLYPCSGLRLHMDSAVLCISNSARLESCAVLLTFSLYPRILWAGPLLRLADAHVTGGSDGWVLLGVFVLNGPEGQT